MKKILLLLTAVTLGGALAPATADPQSDLKGSRSSVELFVGGGPPGVVGPEGSGSGSDGCRWPGGTAPFPRSDLPTRIGDERLPRIPSSTTSPAVYGVTSACCVPSRTTSSMSSFASPWSGFR